MLLIIETDLQMVAGVHLHEPFIPRLDENLSCLRTIKIDEGNPFLKSSLLHKAAKNEELVQLHFRLGFVLLFLPLLDLLAVYFVVVENLVDLLDHVNLRTALVYFLDDHGRLGGEVGSKFQNSHLEDMASFLGFSGEEFERLLVDYLVCTFS